MRLLHLVLAIAISVAVVSDGITTAAAESLQDSDPSYQIVTRALVGDDTALEEEERKGGGGRGGGRGGGGRSTSRGTSPRVYGPYTSIGLMYPNELSHRKTKKKCNRFTNWWKRLFDKSVKKCPKKGEEEGTRRLRA
ncbi:uncharacterized protein IUM83_17447 [Phytophthora cinnamomi]|uniref:uncharacterized protein n=1 Tax=Phytophthora cinnamomi TaxID=4785 RepID=UPI002A268CA2|nr:hypothetical protein IUM83_17447 [Phytophthora cinnamomi]KAJ8527495.1 hypothetical protein ON010_g14770 [Phytophthora cinnamomi]